MRKYSILAVLAGLWALILFAAFLQIDFGGDRPEGWEGIGFDAYLYQQAAIQFTQGQSPYPQPGDVNNIGYPYDLAFLSLTLPLAHTELGVASAVFHIMSFVSYILVAILSVRLVKEEGYQPPAWSWALLLANTGVLGTLAYANIDPSVVAVGIGLLLFLRRKNWLVAGLLVGVLLATKLYWLALLGYVVAQRDWKMLAKTLLVALVFHVVTNGLVILSVGWETGLRLYLDRYGFLGRVATSFVKPDYWGNNSLQQTFYNLFGDGGTLPAILAAVALVGVFLAVTFRAVKQKRPASSTMAYAFFAWVMALLLQPRLEYAGLMATIVIYCWAATSNRSVRMWSLGALPYILAQFPSLIAQFTGIRWLDWSISPTLILGLLTLLVALVLLLREQYARADVAEPAS